MAELRDFKISGFFLAPKPAEGVALTEGVEVCPRKRPTNHDPPPRGRYPARGRCGWQRRGQPTKNLTCLRESLIIVTCVCARVMVNHSADETCQVCLHPPPFSRHSCHRHTLKIFRRFIL